MTDEELFELLYSALETPFGIEVKTDDPDFLRQKLYVLRKSSMTFDCLSFILSPKSVKTHLWILRRPDNA